MSRQGTSSFVRTVLAVATLCLFGLMLWSALSGAEPAKTIPFVRFKGTDRVELEKSQNLIDLNGTFTIEAWVRWDVVDSLKPQYLMGDEAWPGMSAELPIKNICGWVLRTGKLNQFKARTLDFTIGASSNGKAEWFQVISKPLLLSEQGWNHVAICKTPQEVQIFWSGIVIAKRSCRDIKFHESPTNLYLGVRDHAFTDRCFAGDFRALRISSKARYNGKFKPEKRLEKDDLTTVLLDFGAVEKEKIPDLSGNNHHGRITGAVAKSEENPLLATVAEQDGKTKEPILREWEEYAEPAKATESEHAKNLKKSQNNLWKIALAFQNYSDTFGKAPSNFGMEKDLKPGKPHLSWRVALLPFLEEDKLYKEFRFDEPWDSEHNKLLIEKMPAIYSSPRIVLKKKGYTVYQGFAGEGTFFEPGKKIKFPDSITDGPANTILVVESSVAVPWTKPADIPFDPKIVVTNFGRAFGNKPYAAVGDLTVRLLDMRALSPKTLKAAITIAAGDELGSDWGLFEK